MYNAPLRSICVHVRVMISFHAYPYEDQLDKTLIETYAIEFNKTIVYQNYSS